MAEFTLDEKSLTASESKHHLTSSEVKKHWQTPELLDMDYSETKEGPGRNNDSTDGFQS